jgi:hypothetical protein
MQSRRQVAAVFVLWLGVITFGIAFQVKSFQTPNTPRQSPNPKLDGFPVVDFDAPEPTDPTLKSAKEAKERKYNKKYLPKISENTDTLFTVNDWDVGLPAIPVDKSSAIVIGTITKSEAHVTKDKTAIYSEFVLSPDVIIKNDSENPIEVGRSISFERSGGRVRMPSGKIIASWTNHQNMPQVGSRYVLFLTHSYEVQGDVGRDFYLLTGYEIVGGHVSPLDDTRGGQSYKGADEASFMKDLTSEVRSRLD